MPSVIPKGMFGYDPALQPHMRDVEKAKEHLAQSRYPDGLTNVVLATNKANTIRMATLELLKQNLAEVGIEATIIGLNFPDLLSGVQDGKFPVYMLGWQADYAYPDNFIIPYVDGRTGMFARPGGYNDAATNALIDAALAEPDSAKQLDHWQSINRKVHDDYVHLWLSQAKSTHVERTWVTGYYYNPMEAGAPNVGNYAAIGKA